MGRFSTQEPGELIRRARLDVGLTQSQLADRAGVSNSSLSKMESGSQVPSETTLERVLQAADYRPSLPLAAFADQIKALAARRGIERVKVFGSTVRGEDHFDSDIDLLVVPQPQADLFDVMLFADEVRDLTGFPVDVVVNAKSSAVAIAATRDAVNL